MFPPVLPQIHFISVIYHNILYNHICLLLCMLQVKATTFSEGVTLATIRFRLVRCTARSATSWEKNAYFLRLLLVLTDWVGLNLISHQNGKHSEQLLATLDSYSYPSLLLCLVWGGHPGIDSYIINIHYVLYPFDMEPIQNSTSRSQVLLQRHG